MVGVHPAEALPGTVLRHVVETHLERFLEATAAATDGTGVPRFLEREFRAFLGCGDLRRGFARVRCDGCAFERLIPFSCKGRGVCPSCGGRRMAEQAARLERLATLTPRPRINVLLYHGVLAPRARWRVAAVAYGRGERGGAGAADPAQSASRWAEAATAPSSGRGVSPPVGHPASALPPVAAPGADVGSRESGERPAGASPARRWTWAELLISP